MIPGSLRRPAPKAWLRWSKTVQHWTWALHHLGLKGLHNQQDQRQIRILNAINLLAILPSKLVLGCSYAQADFWPESLLMGSTFALVIAVMAGHHRGLVSLGVYRQCTLISSFGCPLILTLMLGGYHNSSLVMLWSLLTPVLAILLDRPQTARLWLGLFLSFNLLVIGLDDPHSTRDRLAALHQGLLAFNGIGVALLIYGCLTYLHRQQRQALDQLDQFASLVAHELRSPLTSISLGVNHCLRHPQPLGPSQLQALQTAQTETKRCQSMLHDLLQISRAPAGASDLVRQRLDPYPLLVELAAAAREQFGRRVQLVCSLGAAERQLWAAPNPLKQMVWNLLENSAKYADPQQPIALALGPDQGGESLSLVVADRGNQLSREQCQAIFAPFYRLSGTRDQKGSGLGLTLVRRFAEAMGGSVSATARDGGGLVIRLCLPRAGHPPGTGQRARPPLASEPSEHQLTKRERERAREREREPLPHRPFMIRNHPQERASDPPKE